MGKLSADLELPVGPLVWPNGSDITGGWAGLWTLALLS
jgi:hypothetical protein